MLQPLACSIIAKYCKSKGLNVWCYTGYTYEQLIKMSKKKSDILKFLKVIDVLIDGPFILDERDITLYLRGSKNQRVLRRGVDF